MPPIPDCPEEIPADKRLIRFSATTVLRLNPLAHKQITPVFHSNRS